MNDLEHAKTLCSARRRNGEPCRNAPMLGSAVCRMHGGAAPQVRRRAQQRLLEASDKAAYRLVQMMQDKSIPPAVQLAAARDLLDRANIVGTQQINVEVGLTKWERHMQEVIIEYTTDDEPDANDAEVVEDDQAETARDEQIRAEEAARLKRKRQGYSGAPLKPLTSRRPR